MRARFAGKAARGQSARRSAGSIFLDPKFGPEFGVFLTRSGNHRSMSRIDLERVRAWANMKLANGR
jgi:hypothetical protein